METESGPAAVTSPRVPRAADQPSGEQRPWLVSSAYDLCFFSNLWWLPLVAIGWLTADLDSWFGLWQVYFLTAPHRWLTLVLVATDADRRAGKTELLAAIAVVTALLVGIVWLVTGSFVCLALIDYLWNAWHFGAQHGGLARMYARRGGHMRSRLQTWTLRLMVVYVSLRLAGWTTGWLEGSSAGARGLMWLDAAVGCTAAAALAWSLRATTGQPGWRAYVGSVAALYLCLLAAINARLAPLVAALVAAGAAFHALEYLALVAFYAQRRKTLGSRNLFATMAHRWLAWLGMYVVLWGSLSYTVDTTWQEAWLGINLWAAYLHYAYDGLIWKLRAAPTAAALAATLPPPGESA